MSYGEQIGEGGDRGRWSRSRRSADERAQGSSEAGELFLLGKEGLQLRGQLRMAGEELLRVGGPARLDGVEVGGQHIIKPLLPFRGWGVFLRHDLLLILVFEELPQFAHAAMQESDHGRLAALEDLRRLG